MNDELLRYYNAELSFLREMGEEFRRAHPVEAGRLMLERGNCADPHVERLIEAVALLTARVRSKIDDEFPEITTAFLNAVAPHLLRPIPSLTIARLDAPPEPAPLAAGPIVPAGSEWRSRRFGNGDLCRFRTTRDVRIWPLRVAEVTFHGVRVPPELRPPTGARSALRVAIESPSELPFARLPLQSLRFYLGGEDRVGHALYEMLFNGRVGAVLRDPTRPDEPIPLNDAEIAPVGLDPDDGLLPYPPNAIPAYRILMDYFALPKKFLFADVFGFDRLRRFETGGRRELVVFFRTARDDFPPMGPEHFQLHCAPMANLFRATAEPIRVTGTRTEYPVIPEAGRARTREVFSIDAVESSDSLLETKREYEPFFASRHRRGGAGSAAGGGYWYATRRPATSPDDPGTEVTLTFVDAEFRPRAPASEILSARITCTNRDQPRKLPVNDEREGDFEPSEAVPARRAVCVEPMTRAKRPSLGRGQIWDLVSALSLNHLALAPDENANANGNGNGNAGGGDPAALRRVLELHHWDESEEGDAFRARIEGVRRVSSRASIARVGDSTVARGREVAIEFDESKYSGGTLFLFASVLERFLGAFASLNSFSRLVARDSAREIKRWRPRAGDRTLL